MDVLKPSVGRVDRLKEKVEPSREGRCYPTHKANGEGEHNHGSRGIHNQPLGRSVGTFIKRKRFRGRGS